jgi:hypothetical protein
MLQSLQGRKKAPFRAPWFVLFTILPEPFMACKVV